MQNDISLGVRLVVNDRYLGISHHAWDSGTGEVVCMPSARCAIDPEQEQLIMDELARWISTTVAALRDGTL